MRNRSLAASSLRICLAFACTAGAACGPGEEATHVSSQAERWSTEDRPFRFASRLERRASELPEVGSVERVPWPGSYWPTAKDSINHRWNGPGSHSPAKKYEIAFGRRNVEDAVSRHHGVDSLRHSDACGPGRRCQSGEVCAKRRGETGGRCVPTWYGLCHGWAAASILFPEPQRPVVRNGVTFEVQDIKALLTLVHDDADYKDISGRCERDADHGGMRYDPYGRPEPDCRDTNPGTFHIILTNYVGLRRTAFIMDRDFAAEVWNQPIRRYEIREQRPVSAEEATSLIAGGGAPPWADYPFNPAAASLLHVKTDVQYVMESTPDADGALLPSIADYTETTRYQYVLELDADGRIIGGEWAAGSKREHPDFLWLPLEDTGGDAAGGAISYEEVESLAEESVAP